MGMVTEARLHYNNENDRFGIKVDGEWEVEGLHCGQTFEVMVDGAWIPARIEMRWKGNIWYLVDTPFWGDGLEGKVVRNW